MLMAMMDVRVMRMRMPERLVAVRMHMRLGAVPLKIMLVPVMRIMAVGVRMRHGFMRVLMFVRFGQVQPDAGAHQRGGDPEDGTRMFAQHQQRNCRTNERRRREIRAGSRSAEMPQSQDKHHQTEAVAAKADDAGR